MKKTRQRPKRCTASSHGTAAAPIRPASAYANIDFFGNVHPDQFWQDYTFGNVRERNFGDIWMDESDPLMRGLKHKAEYIKGRCRLCRYRDLCTGAMRVRAFRTYNDPVGAGSAVLSVR